MADECEGTCAALLPMGDLRLNLIAQPEWAARVHGEGRTDRGVADVAKPGAERLKIKIASEQAWNNHYQAAIAPLLPCAVDDWIDQQCAEFRRFPDHGHHLLAAMIS